MKATQIIYKSNGTYFKSKNKAYKHMKDIAIDYWKENQLDERTLESLPCGGEQYVADRYLKGDNAIIVSYVEIINVI